MPRHGGTKRKFPSNQETIYIEFLGQGDSGARYDSRRGAREWETKGGRYAGYDWIGWALRESSARSLDASTAEGTSSQSRGLEYRCS